jgi:hypothetical protein
MAGHDLLAEKIKQYAYNLIGTQLKTEIDQQFDNWIGPGSFIARLGDAQEEAIKNHMTVLKRVEDDKKAAFERAMFILSLAAGPILSWVAGSIQYKLGPKLFTKKVFDWSGPVITFVKNEEDKVSSKILSDLAKDLISKGMPALIGAGVDAGKPANVAQIVNSNDTITLKTNLEVQIREQKVQAINEVMKIAQNINNSQTFGEDILDSLYSEHSALSSKPDDWQETVARQKLNDVVQAARVGWAAKYPIYGMQVPKVSSQKLVNTMERGIWALWILQSDLRLKKIPQIDVMVPWMGLQDDMLPEKIVLHITELTGLFSLALEYDKRRTSFTQAGIDSFRNWAKSQVSTANLSSYAWSPRVLNPIEKNF